MASKLALPAPRPAELRIVLVGKTGTGKSATGNTILRNRCFVSRPCTTSVTSECQKEEFELDGQTLAVIDTPGLFDTRKTDKEVAAEVVKCIYFAAPGPHVFLVVIQLTRFTKEEQDTVDIIQKMFGEEASKYTMVLFTHGDQLKRDGASMEKLLEEDSKLKAFVDQCHGGYHVFDNTVKDDSQVRELQKKINSMVEENGGSYYTNDMFEKAEKAKEQEMEIILRENRNMNRKDARRSAEKDGAFIKAVVAAAAFGFGAGASTAYASSAIRPAEGAAEESATRAAWQRSVADTATAMATSAIAKLRIVLKVKTKPCSIQ